MSRESSQTQVVDKPQSEPARPICCRSCGAVVVPRKALNHARARGEHTFRNPAGYSFHVMTFPLAPGCRCEGPTVAEASWFAGTTWQLALCKSCETHLGWKYEGVEESFFGLIVTRLTL